MLFVLAASATQADEIIEEEPDSIIIDGVEYEVPNPHLRAVERWRSNYKPKIIGGADAVTGQFPWQVSLRYSWPENPTAAHFCGGALLAPGKVLTAAHCVNRPRLDRIRVSAGGVALGEEPQTRELARKLVHKTFRHPRLGDDIAILELKEPFKLSENIGILQLIESDGWFSPPDRETGHGATEFTTLGWGATDDAADENSPILKFLDDVPFATREDCKGALSRGRYVTSQMMCAGYVEGGKDTCQGDSGGPLVTQVDGAYVQAGIISWGEGCAVPRKYGVYTRITAYADWVTDCLDPDKVCLAK